jgi:hypothetical protein
LAHEWQEAKRLAFVTIKVVIFLFLQNQLFLKKPFTGTPETVDFLHELNADFKSNITDHLDKLSRDALLSQDDSCENAGLYSPANSESHPESRLR